MSELMIKSNRDVRVIDIKYYPDGMPIITDCLTSRDKYVALLRPKSINSFMAAMFWFDSQSARGIKINELILPFVPGARQDRLNKTGDQLFTLKSIAEIINARKFKKVVVLDPHSDVTPALINNCKIINAADCIRSFNNKLIGVLAPDGGAEKRAFKVAEKLNLPLYHAWKTRDVTTGKITGFGMETPPSPGRLLLVDDICDGGGTFLGLAKEIHARECKADLYITHGLFTQGTGIILKNFIHVYTTDSVLTDKSGTEVNDICNQLLLRGTV